VAIKLGELVIQLTAQTSAFTKGMTDARQMTFTSVDGIVGSLKRVGDSLSRLKFDNAKQIERSFQILGGVVAGVSLAMGAALTFMVGRAIASADKLHDLAMATGLTTEFLSGMSLAARLNGVSLEAFAKASERLSRNMLATAQGIGVSRTAFKQLGIDVTDGKGHLLSLQEVLFKIADHFATMPDGPMKTGLAMQFLGKAGAELIPMLNGGSKELKKYLELAQRLGIIVGQDVADAADRFGDSMLIARAAMDGVGMQITAGMLPALNNLIEAFFRVEQHDDKMKKFGEGIGSSMRNVSAWFIDAAYYMGVWAVKQDTWNAKLAGAAAAGITGGPLAAIAALFKKGPDQDALLKGLEDEHRKQIDRLYGITQTGGELPKLKTDKPVVVGGKEAPVDRVSKKLADIAAERKAIMDKILAQDLDAASILRVVAAAKADEEISKLRAGLKAKEKAELDAIAPVMRQEIIARELDANALKQMEQARGGAIKKADEQIAAEQRLIAAAPRGLEAMREAELHNQIAVETADLVIARDLAEGRVKEQLTSIIEAVTAARRREAAVTGAEKAISGATGQTEQLRQQTSATDNLARATSKGNDAVRQAELQNRIANATRELGIQWAKADAQGKLEIADAAEKLVDSEVQLFRAEEDLRNQQEMMRYLAPSERYDMEIARLEKLRDMLQAAGRSTAYLAEEERRLKIATQEANDELLRGTGTALAGITVGMHQYARNVGTMADMMERATTTALRGIEGAMSSHVSAMLMGTETIAEGFRNMGRDMLQAIVDALSQMLAQWIVTHIIMAAVSKILGFDQTGKKEVAEKQKQSRQKISADAGVVGADVFRQAIEKIPFPANLAIAPPLAMGMATLAGAFSSLTMLKAAGGGIVPGAVSGDVVPAMLTPREGVLTVDEMRAIQGARRENGSGASRGISVTVHSSPVLQALDATGADAILERHAQSIGRIVRSELRNGRMPYE